MKRLLGHTINKLNECDVLMHFLLFLQLNHFVSECSCRANSIPTYFNVHRNLIKAVKGQKF